MNVGIKYKLSLSEHCSEDVHNIIIEVMGTRFKITKTKRGGLFISKMSNLMNDNLKIFPNSINTIEIE